MKVVPLQQFGTRQTTSSDSARTRVDQATTSLWMTVFAPLSVSPETMREHAETARRLMASHLAPPDVVVETTGQVVELAENQ